MYSLRYRNESGSLGALMLSALILIVVCIGALATDFAQMLAVKNQLQNAVDAGALAGGQDLWTDVAKAEANAYAVTAKNVADNRLVSNQSPGIQVQVAVTAPAAPATQGKGQVDGSVQVHNILGGILGRYYDVVTAHAVAGSVGKLQTLNADQAFPLAVSYDSVPANSGAVGLPLSSLKIGDIMYLNFNTQKYKNAAWTSLTNPKTNPPYIDPAIDQAIGLKPVVPGYVPSVSIGDDINLTNGVIGEKDMAKSPRYQALIDPDLPPLTLPVISGEPPFNQSKKVIGFISFKPTGVILGKGNGPVETLIGTLEKTQLRGVSGAGSQTAGVTQLLPGPIQLIE